MEDMKVLELNKLKQDLIYTTDADILLTYGADVNKYGICGHFFEVIEYYLFLKKYTKYSIEILLGEEILLNDINIALSKYRIKNISELPIKISRPRIIKAPNTIVIYTDGFINKKITYSIKHMILFPCGIKDYTNSGKNTIPKNLKNKISILGDSRLNYLVEDDFTFKHYVKKIFFDIFYPRRLTKSKKYLTLYATSNCKLISEDTIYRIRNEYPNLPILLLINPNSPLLQFKSELKEINVELRFVPIHNLFEKIDTYLYTSIARKWDCSPRMLAECKFYGIPYLLDNDINDEYLSDDLGLKYRLEDIEKDFESLYLKENDLIIEVIDSIFKEKD